MKTTIHHDDNRDFNDSKENSRSISMPAQHNKTLFAKSESYTDIDSDAFARRDKKCRKNEIDNLQKKSVDMLQPRLSNNSNTDQYTVLEDNVPK